MPVKLWTLAGKVDEDVEHQIRAIVMEVNRLDGEIAPVDLAPLLAEISAINSGLSDLARRTQAISQQLEALTARVAALEAAP